MTTNVVSEVQTRLDESGGAVFFVAQQVYDALNEATLMLAARTKIQAAPLPITLPAGQSYLALPGTLTFIPQYLLINGRKYFFTTYAKLEQYNRYWQNWGSGQPTHFVLRDYKTLRMFPPPDQDYYATLWGVPYPATEISGANLTSSWPPLLVDSLIYAATAELLEHTHPQLSDAYTAESEEYLNKYKVQLRRRSGHNILVMAPAYKRVQVAQSGEVSAGVYFGAPSPLLVKNAILNVQDDTNSIDTNR